MKKKTAAKTGKIRQNLTMDADIRSMFSAMAKGERTTMSALLTRWILEKAEDCQPNAAQPLEPNRHSLGHGGTTDRGFISRRTEIPS